MSFEYDSDDKVDIGDMKPKIEGNVNTNLSWKGFNLYLLFKYRLGGKIYNSTLASRVEGANPYKNVDKRALYDRWKNPGIMLYTDESVTVQPLIRQAGLFSMIIYWLCRAFHCLMIYPGIFPVNYTWNE